MPKTATATDDSDEDIVTLSSKTLAGDLRDFILDRLKNDHDPLPWQMRGEAAQREVVRAVEAAVRVWVHRAVVLIAAGGQQAARCSLVKFQSKDGIQMQVNMAASDAMRHALMDHVGNTVLVILADSEAFSGQRSAAPISKDQKEIFDDEPDADKEAA